MVTSQRLKYRNQPQQTTELIETPRKTLGKYYKPQSRRKMPMNILKIQIWARLLQIKMTTDTMMNMELVQI